MAKKNNPSTSSTTPDKYSNQTKARLIIGSIFLLVGSFITFSIISYFFTWKEDQDYLLSFRNTGEFLNDNNSIIHNWGGRLGAYISHKLVFEYVGIFALAISLWLCLAGLYILYNKKILKLAKYLRWTCLQ